MLKPVPHTDTLNPEQSWLREKQSPRGDDVRTHEPELAQDSELLTPDDWDAIEKLVIKMLEEKQANSDELLDKSFLTGGTR